MTNFLTISEPSSPCVKYLVDRLEAEMVRGQMHVCLRDIGRLAGGYFASGDLPGLQLQQVQDVAVSLAINKDEAVEKWSDAVDFGRTSPVRWAEHGGRPDRVLDWSDTINDDTYRIDTAWAEPVDVVEPDTWDPVSQIRTYLNLLFEPDDFVGYVVDSREKEPGKWIPGSRGNCTRTCKQLLDELDQYNELGAVFGDAVPQAGAWIRANPLDGQGVKDANVTEFRYALVECDDKEMEIEQQRGIYEKLELPIALLVHSGNKSLHAIVKIEAADLAEYKRRVDLLYEVCGRNGLKIDTANKNPSRLSRMPGVMRGDRKQFIVAHASGKSSWQEWEEWIEKRTNAKDDFPLLTATELHRGDFRVHFFVGRVFASRQEMVIAGPSKSAKTSLAFSLGMALASGTPWLDEFQVPEPVRVAVFTGESGFFALQNLERRVAIAAGIDLEDPDFADRFVVCEKIPNLSDAQNVDRFGRVLERRRIKVAIIDPLYLSVGEAADTSSVNKMGPLYRRLGDICKAAECTPVLIHHTVKRPGSGVRRSIFEPLTREDMHGAGISEWCRQWILVNPAAGYEDGRHKLNMVVGGSAGHSGRFVIDIDEGEFDAHRPGNMPGPGLEKWVTRVSNMADEATNRLAQESETREKKESGKAERDRANLEADRKEILEVLSRIGEPTDRKEVRGRTPMQEKRFHRAWNSLVDDKTIVQDGTTRKGNGQHYPVFRATNEPLVSH